MSRSNRPLGHYDFPPRNPSTNDQLRRPRGNSRRHEIEPLRSIPVQVDSSSDDDDIPVTKPSRAAQHSRSMSHPFPSLFSSKKKKNARPEDESGTGDFAADIGSIGPKPIPQQNMAPRMIQRGPADFATGNCMTCASLVRWPKELYTFRCTICLTINDIRPYDSAAGHTGTPSGISGASPPNETEFGSSRRPSQSRTSQHHISLDRTKHIIKQCLHSSLESYISAQSHPERTQFPPEQFLSHSPNENSANIDSSRKQDGLPASSNCPPSHAYNAVFDDFADLNLEPNPLNRNVSMPRSYSTSYPDVRSSTFPVTNDAGKDRDVTVSELEPKMIFKKLEEYLVSCFSSHLCINNSFPTRHMSASSKLPSEVVKQQVPETKKESVRDDTPISELDPKLLLLGDFAENGTWWTGGQEEVQPSKIPPRRKSDVPSIVSSRSPRIDWAAVSEWYRVVVNAAQLWPEVYAEMVRLGPHRALPDAKLSQFEALVISAQEHLQQVLLKCTESLLKRPGRLMKEPQDVRFLLLMLVNPLFISGFKSYSGQYQNLGKEREKRAAIGQDVIESQTKTSERYSGIIKRIFGLLANSSEPCHQHLITWLSRVPEHLFLQTKDLISGFMAYRLNRQSQKKVEPRIDMTGGLIPQMSNSRSSNTAASLHAALESSKSKKRKQPVEPVRAAYTDDWQVKAAARVMALIYAANNLTHVRRVDKSGGRSHGHLLPISDFYSSLVDGLDFKADFELWESKRGRFTFCQYPFFLSIWAKIQILEFDAKRQMAGKAREAFFDSILTHKNYAQYLMLNIRRECLVEDSLKQVSEVVGSGGEEIKKGLRIEFKGEEGIDGGGLRKEWFLLLVREVFNPDHGLFVYDEDSNFCYFNPNTFETSDQYFLVGVVLGLAIYNSTILDVAFPPFAFRKLLASAPPPTPGTPAHSRPSMSYTLDDLAEFRPVLARGLRQLLDYEGDVQSTFCLDFVVEIEKYGTRVRVPLCPGGESKMVTNANRREYVDLYVRYLLDTSVSRQFEPFKRGFFTVCAGNALTLFKPEEIELLIRGSDEPLNITALQGAAEYTNWPGPPDRYPTIRWFWDTFERASITDQRRLLSFITGSDRIPAMGAASLVIKINCLGDDEGRFPSARTCFNVLGLYRYTSRQRLETSLWRAVNESEGFGLK